MWLSFKMGQLLKLLFVVCIGSLSLIRSVAAQERPVFAHIVWVAPSVQYDGSGRRIYFESPKAAYEVERAFQLRPGHGGFINDIFNLQPGVPPYIDRYYNGFPSTYFADSFAYNDFTKVIPGQGHLFMVYTSWLCPVGWGESVTGTDYRTPPMYNTYICTPPSKPELDCDGDCKNKNNNGGYKDYVGKPIHLSTGVEQMIESDYVGAGANDLRMTRRYRSDHGLWRNNYQVIAANLSDRSLINTVVNNALDFPPIKPAGACYKGIAQYTGAKYCFEYAPTGKKNDFFIQRSNGRIISFGNNTDVSPRTDIDDRLTQSYDAGGNLTGWKVVRGSDDATEFFNSAGRLFKVVSRTGQTQTYVYSDGSTPATMASEPGQLIKIVDHFGREIQFTYRGEQISKMIDPAGNVYTYGYDEASSYVYPGQIPPGNLTSVTFPDGKKRIYWYNEPANTANTNLPTVLTGITDENGIRYATIKYDKYAYAISTELANGIDKYTVSYGTTDRTVVYPLGASVTHNFSHANMIAKGTSIILPALPGTPQAISRRYYDANGNLSSSWDFKGVITDYTYNLSRNLETKRVEASGTVDARTTSTIWHPTFRIPTQIDAPLLRTTYTHDANGNVLTKTEQATTDVNGSQGAAAAVVGTPRVWRYTYNTIGQVLTATGPRTDVVDTTTYTYDNQGNLVTVTNAAGHVTTMSNYDPHGHVGTITDPNGVVTNLTYHVRGWLLSRAVTADGITETTNYTYDGVGQMTKVTLPDNSTVNYTYDDAHRLTQISDHLGNSITYTLDNMGNRTKEEVKDSTGALSRQVTRVYDALSRLKEVTGAAQ